MVILTDIHSLTDFQRNAKTYLERIRRSGRPGGDSALMNGILHVCIERGWVDQGFIDNHTTGFEAVKEAVAKYTPLWFWSSSPIAHFQRMPIIRQRGCNEIRSPRPRSTCSAISTVSVSCVPSTRSSSGSSITSTVASRARCRS